MSETRLIPLTIEDLRAICAAFPVHDYDSTCAACALTEAWRRAPTLDELQTVLDCVGRAIDEFDAVPPGPIR